MVVWVQKWEETEAGWGCRPDGYTLHKAKEDIQTFLRRMRDREAAEGYGPGRPPPEYSRPCGDPYQADVTDQVILDRLQGSPDGVWGITGNRYPVPVAPGTDQTGWVNLPGGMQGRTNTP